MLDKSELKRAVDVIHEICIECIDTPPFSAELWSGGGFIDVVESTGERLPKSITENILIEALRSDPRFDKVEKGNITLAQTRKDKPE